MENLNKRASMVATALMEAASSIRTETGKELSIVFAFSVEGVVDLVPAETIPHKNKSELSENVRMMAALMGAELVFMVSEVYVSMNPMAGAPSEDPARLEAIVVSASGAGVNIFMSRQINGDGTLGEVEVNNHVGGTMSNLSGREMMN